MKFKASSYFQFTSHAAFGSSLSAWLKILWVNRFSIHPYFLPKAIFISIAIVLGIPFRWYERFKYKRRIEAQQVKQPVFILGHPRSGTTYLHYLLSKDPQFNFCSTAQAILPHVFMTGSKVLVPLIAKALPEVRPMDNLRMGSAMPKEEDFALVSFGPESLISGFYFPKHYAQLFHEQVLFNANADGKRNWQQHFDYFLRKLLLANGGRTLLLKSPANTGRVKEILELYPDAKFIHIHRHPYEVYSSNLHLFEKMLPILSFQQVSKAAIAAAILETYVAMYHKYLSDRLEIPAGNLVELAYADLVKDPETEIRKIYQSLNLPGIDKALPYIQEEIKSYKDYEKNRFTLDDSKKAELAKRWKFAFDAFNYKP